MQETKTKTCFRHNNYKYFYKMLYFTIIIIVHVNIFTTHVHDIDLIGVWADTGLIQLLIITIHKP